MKIISGTLGRRNVKTLQGDATRPTSSKVRGAIFNALGQYFSGGQVLDLFAGSGAMGIEAISRGCDHATFVDISNEAIKVIKDNIQTLQIEQQTTVLKNDYAMALKRLKHQVFQFIFVDPPYNMQIIENILEQIQTFDLLQSGGNVVLEYSNMVHPTLEFDSEIFAVQYEKKFDATTVLILQRK